MVVIKSVVNKTKSLDNKKKVKKSDAKKFTKKK